MSLKTRLFDVTTVGKMLKATQLTAGINRNLSGTSAPANPAGRVIKMAPLPDFS